MKAITVIALLLLAISPSQAHLPVYEFTSYGPWEDEYGARTCTGNLNHDGIVAADLRYHPLGTKLWALEDRSSNFWRMYVVGDCGSAVKGPYHFDRYCSTRSRQRDWDTRWLRVSFVNPYESQVLTIKAGSTLIKGIVFPTSNFTCQYSSMVEQGFCKSQAKGSIPLIGSDLSSGAQAHVGGTGEKADANCFRRLLAAQATLNGGVDGHAKKKNDATSNYGAEASGRSYTKALNVQHRSDYQSSPIQFTSSSKASRDGHPLVAPMLADD